jgi:hypothetical protein
MMSFMKINFYISPKIIANSTRTTEINDHELNLLSKLLSFYAGD